MTLSRGRLIAIEGIDGTGKSTLAKALDAALRNAGVDTVLSREPTNGPHGTKIREIARSGRDDISPQEETELFIADRRDHVREVIAPALASGKWVVLDRYFYSTVAYQGANGVDIRWILNLHHQFAPEPDLLVILKLDVASALDRIRKSRGGEPDHFEKAEYLSNVALIFEHIEHPCLLALDARASTEMMIGRIMEAVAPWLTAETP
ncbi:dTMP kinase [Candidatus Sumerlaeota bacterium]|nr:dTMP kinase [Candidatus Sumerlaeota bacterium]